VIRDITERQRVQEQLRKSALYARSLLEASLDPLVTISRDGKVLDVNQATELATGIERETLIGSVFCDYFTDPDKARQGYEQVFAEETVRDYPLAIRHTSGKITDVLYNATVFRNEVGEIEGVFAAARDITERKRVQEQKPVDFDQFRETVKSVGLYWLLINQPPVSDGLGEPADEASLAK
jgi:PAS domain S-box-containing protein